MMGKFSKRKGASATAPSTPKGDSALALLKELESRGWTSSPLSSSLKEPVTQLVFSYYCSSHSNAGGKFHSQEIHSIAVNFLKWMNKSRAWAGFAQKYDVKNWNDLQLGLSREFLKYINKEDVEPSSAYEISARSLRAPRTSSPKSSWMAEISEELSKHFVEAYEALMESDETLQSPEYLLYLEGWSPDEVAHVLCTSTEDVSSKIESAKSRSLDAQTWRNLK